MKILFVHQNFPAQFVHLAPALVEKGHEVSAMTLNNPNKVLDPNIKVFKYTLSRGNASDGHPWMVDFESKLIRGEACLRLAFKLRESGYQPEIIIAHPGWGESLFLKEVWPNAKLKLYCEFFYHTRGADVGFDPEFVPNDPADSGRVIVKNANNLIQFHQADAAISPTHWQASTFPDHVRDKISVIFDGIDTDRLVPNRETRLSLGNGQLVTSENEVVTFVNRSLEPYRGFHIFMRSLPKLLADRPDALVLLVGGEGVSYGAASGSGKSWKNIMCEEVLPQLDDQQKKRIHFLGNVEYEKFVALLQVSSVHVYLTYPFVLSWSLLEAMSVGCTIVASDTQPVHEVITHNTNGVLVNFFNSEGLANSVTNLLSDSKTRYRLGSAARQFAISNYDLNRVCLPQQLAWATQ